MEIWERDRRCDRAVEVHSAAPSGKEESKTPAVPTPVDGGAVSGKDEVKNPGPSGPVGGEVDGFLKGQYDTATREIIERLSNENVLFALKFTLLGGIMAVLFSLIGKKDAAGADFERFIQKRRVGIFFVAALLCGVIVDTRLRFNGKVIESLGDWVWCVEGYQRTKGARVTDSLPAFWEHFLHLQLQAGSYPIMRYFCHFLTAVLYAVTLYLFIVMPRTMNRSNKTMLVQGGRLFFMLLFFISVSYDRLHFYPHDYSNYMDYVKAPGTLLTSGLPSLLISLLLAISGAWSLRRALDFRFALCNAFVQSGEIKPAEKLALLGERVKFACFHRPRALLDEVEKEADAETGVDRKILDLVNSSECAAKISYDRRKGWRVDNPIQESGFAKVLDEFRNWRTQKRAQRHAKTEDEKMQGGIRAVQRRQVLRNLPWIRKDNPEWSEHEAELAEERLWDAYFSDSERALLPIK